MSNLISRSWNGTPIQRRTTDGYVNATAMCRANDKRWSKYRESDRANEYLEALSTEVRISVSGLIESKLGGSNGGETWIHPQIAVDMARWISAPFAVWMDSWFIGELNTRVSQVREVQPQLPDVLSTVERSIGLLERLGGVDDRAQLLLKDIVLNHAAKSAGGTLLLPGQRMLSLQEGFLEFTDATPSEASKLATSCGKSVKRFYVEVNGRPPKTHKQLVNGRSCDVCDYEFDWLEGIQNDLKSAVSEFRSQKTR